MPNYALGFDFGTESVRALLVDVRDGRIGGRGSHAYTHGVIDGALPTGGGALPPDYALQHPGDWLDSMRLACGQALAAAHASADDVIGIGVDFTSCTMLPARRDGTPLCLLPEFSKMPLAWPRLWKHHSAKAETDRINEVARERRERWLDRYGGVIGLEWFFPKVLETLTHEPKIYAFADVWLEAGDWLVWQLIAGPFPACDTARLVRSTCQAGYKAMWNSINGYPSAEYFAAVRPEMADVVTARMPGRLLAPGKRAGTLTPAAARLLGLSAGTPVSAAIIDAHAGVPGAGVASPATLVMVMGTSSCHMMMSDVERFAPGVAGVVQDGILPGFFGYETGQASVGDAFGWLAKLVGQSHEKLTAGAVLLPPGSGGVLAFDWLNGCRTPLMDGRLSGAFIGLTLNTRPPQLYRALMEATAIAVRWIVDTLRDAGIPLDAFVASGGLPGKSPLLMQIYADVLGHEIRLASCDQSVALGAAILGALAAGRQRTGFAQAVDAINVLAPEGDDLIYRPRPVEHQRYAELSVLYRELALPGAPLGMTMHRLREFSG